MSCIYLVHRRDISVLSLELHASSYQPANDNIMYGGVADLMQPSVAMVLVC